MARVVWPSRATTRLDEIEAYIADRDPVAALRIARRLIALGDSLADFPNRGRPAASGTREMTGMPPYVLRYRVVGEFVVILDIRHGRQRPR